VQLDAPERMKSAAFEPERVADPHEEAARPLFFSVKLVGALADPTEMDPKFEVDG
jgi:hypothetical protein